MDDSFTEFRQKFSNAYPGDRRQELRFLLHDHLPIGVLSKEHNSGMDLFNELKTKGIIKYNNVKIMSEIADVTENADAKASVSKYKKEVGKDYDGKGGKSLSSHRKTFYKAMDEITEELDGGDVHKLVGYYGLSSQGITNKWDLVFYLEKELQLNTRKKLERFANQLNASAKVKLLGEQPVAGGGVVEATSTAAELTDDDYKLFKTTVSAYYDDRPDCRIMLMVLFGDHVPTQNHKTRNSTIDWLNALEESDDLSSDDISIVYDTINLTEHYALQKKIKKEKLPFPEVRPIEITNFSNYRQKIMKFGKGITPNDVAKIDGYYNNPVKKYKSSWGMIYDLEFEKSIFKESNIDEFVAKLKQLKLPSSSAELLE
ncbi:uncharacterized protein [Antedon mediterranea]|uniref:uncharacterized protein n=1 Tax=Antedon mediterranea TaxID=105859 RepID=UPI003AF8387D